jgi:hypothetical protein
MSDDFALAPVRRGTEDAELAALEARLAERKAALEAYTAELRRLQVRYLDEVGALYGQWTELEAAVEAEEIRAGIRIPALEDEAGEESPAGEAPPGASVPPCASGAGPSDDLKRVFRDVAKAIHPDLALDDRARFRRHSLMAAANRAYAERDADRLRLILHAWERSPDAVPMDDPNAEPERRRRRAAEIDEALVAIEAEWTSLHTSAIGRLKHRIDDARAQGWDLFAEMILQVKREIARATARLATLRRK